MPGYMDVCGAYIAGNIPRCALVLEADGTHVGRERADGGELAVIDRAVWSHPDPHVLGNVLPLVEVQAHLEKAITDMASHDPDPSATDKVELVFAVSEAMHNASLVLWHVDLAVDRLTGAAQQIARIHKVAAALLAYMRRQAAKVEVELELLADEDAAQTDATAHILELIQSRERPSGSMAAFRYDANPDSTTEREVGLCSAVEALHERARGICADGAEWLAAIERAAEAAGRRGVGWVCMRVWW